MSFSSCALCGRLLPEGKSASSPPLCRGCQFWRQAGLPAVVDAGGPGGWGACVRVVEIDGCLQVVVQVGDHATHDDLRAAIPLALQWRDRLVEHQGPSPTRIGFVLGGSTLWLRERLDRLHRAGFSYAQLAANVNAWLVECLQEEVAHGDESSSAAAEMARDGLRAVGFKPDEIEDHLREALASIRARGSPYHAAYPVDGAKIRSTLLSHRRRKKR